MQLTANFSLAELTVTGRNMPNVPNEAEVAREEAYRQQIEAGKLAPENVQCTWSDTNDRLTRHSHRAMNGQKRMFGEPFQTPSGALLNYPGDTSLGAGAEEVVGCRCTKQYRIDMTAEVLRGQQVR